VITPDTEEVLLKFEQYVLCTRTPLKGGERLGDVRVSSRIPKKILRLKLRCQCGGSHQAIYTGTDACHNRYRMTSFTRVTDKCGPVVTVAEIAEFYEKRNPAFRNARKRTASKQPLSEPHHWRLVRVREGEAETRLRDISERRTGVRKPVQQPGSRGALPNGRHESEEVFVRDMVGITFPDFVLGESAFRANSPDCFLRAKDGQPHRVVYVDEDGTQQEAYVAFFWLELKNQNQPLSPDQKATILDYARAGLLVVVAEVERV
jgi:hypothetical protein